QPLTTGEKNEPLDEKRTICGYAAARPGAGDEPDGAEAGVEDLVAGLHDLPGYGGPHHRGPRRAPPHPGVCYREYGGPQTGRIRFYPIFQGPYQGLRALASP